ncbi:hypothetical protein M378DRAFT_322499 [Amanita muscaria Koide BX008]|uniref:C2H2-type domain-containing protein n=1 Tax=Amanita muscaria (strain Koide BX008) TaxID=946122 RepID=A0A0C2TJ39_AMAMK|nr:hypothetical protein M378DRAFT_322499 [Amanita muscaria Koide BX008]
MSYLEPLSNMIGEPLHPKVTGESYFSTFNSGFNVNSISGHLASPISNPGHDVKVEGWGREYLAGYQNASNHSQGNRLLDVSTVTGCTLPSSHLCDVPLSATTSVRFCRFCNVDLNRDMKLPTQSIPDITPAYEENLSDDGTKRYRCQCGRKTKSVGDMRRHHESLMHSSKRKYGCLPCGKTFTRKDGLVRHEKSCKKKHNCAIGASSLRLVLKKKSLGNDVYSRFAQKALAG